MFSLPFSNLRFEFLLQITLKCILIYFSLHNSLYQNFCKKHSSYYFQLLQIQLCCANLIKTCCNTSRNHTRKRGKKLSRASQNLFIARYRCGFRLHTATRAPLEKLQWGKKSVVSATSFLLLTFIKDALRCNSCRQLLSVCWLTKS